MGLAGLILGYVNLGVSLFMIPLLLAIAIPNFVKARTTAQKNVCIINLRLIDGAKEQWSLENKKSPGDLPTMTDLSPYLKNGSMQCPAAGRYTINAVGTAPKCSVPGHELPEKN
ncbi:MAG: hypothetical protein JWM68_3167 [Verrucomicrobiales bacterium]|nr:hypothetical protein [Verrucomicrobiales bacterium]